MGAVVSISFSMPFSIAFSVLGVRFLKELRSVFATYFNGHGLLIRDYIGELKLQEGPHFALFRQGPLRRLMLTVAHIATNPKPYTLNSLNPKP